MSSSLQIELKSEIRSAIHRRLLMLQNWKENARWNESHLTCKSTVLLHRCLGKLNTLKWCHIKASTVIFISVKLAKHGWAGVASLLTQIRRIKFCYLLWIKLSCEHRICAEITVIVRYLCRPTFHVESLNTEKETYWSKGFVSNYYVTVKLKVWETGDNFLKALIYYKCAFVP